MPTTRKSTKPPKPSRLKKVGHWVSPAGRHCDRDLSTEVTVKGPRGGRFRFLHHVVDTANGNEWIDVYGPITSVKPAVRSFPLDRIDTVHTKVKGR